MAVAIGAGELLFQQGDEQIPTGQTESMVVWQRMLICGKTGTFLWALGKNIPKMTV